MVKTQPTGVMKLILHNKTTISCHAEGNPVPKYQWIKRLSNNRETIKSYTSQLVIEDVGYVDQGEYRCVAVNRIGGKRREAKSDAVRIEVVGSPISVKDAGEVVGTHGSDVTLDVEFCSDPVPSESAWEWGEIVLPLGSEIGDRFKAELVSHPHMEDCYISRLTVKEVTIDDGTEYRLILGNIHGNDVMPVTLRIKGT